jgi:2',3'-cyclic-nucleotide 2'-phosphodiesterase (5'-nucleotidase family)
VIGNHDLDDGARHFLDVTAGHATVPILSANLFAKGDLRDWMLSNGYGASATGALRTPEPAGRGPEPGRSDRLGLAAPWRMVEIGGLRVAILGLTTDALPYLVAPSGIAGVDVEDATRTAREWVPVLRERERADLVIALTHQGLEEDRRLARSVPGIDVIVGGHSHTALHRPVWVRESRTVPGGAVIVQAGRYGEYLGRLDLEIVVSRTRDDGTRTCEVDAARGSLLRLVEGDPDDPAIRAFLAPFADSMETRLAEPVAVLPEALSARETRVRETAIGNLLADAVRWAGEADLAVVNGGGIRGSLPAGTVTLGDIYQMVPFDNAVVVFTLTGEELRAVLDRAARNAGGGGFLQVSGVRFTIRDREARDITVGGVPLADEARYRVATISFLASGGDGYREFAALTPRETRFVAREALLRYLARERDLRPGVDGRIRLEDAPRRRSGTD